MTPDDVLSTWFGDLRSPDYPQPQPQLWWGKDPDADAALAERFGDALRAASHGNLDGWTATPRGTLALIVLRDQLSRNIHRDKPEMYAQDDAAQHLALRALLDGVDGALTPKERVFLFMPLMHAESVALQRLCVDCFARLVEQARPADREDFEKNLDYARRHLVIVERFGRFPHRNEILGRESTAEERSFLTEPGSSF